MKEWCEKYLIDIKNHYILVQLIKHGSKKSKIIETNSYLELIGRDLHQNLSRKLNLTVYSLQSTYIQMEAVRLNRETSSLILQHTTNDRDTSNNEPQNESGYQMIF